MRDTIELCKAAGFPLMSFEGVTYVSPELERLVAFVRADERAAPAANDEALKLALEALEAGEYYIDDLEAIVYASDDLGTHEDRAKMQEAITAIKQALAAPVQDSTCNETLRAQGKAYPRTCKKCGKGPCIALANTALDKKAENPRELGLDYEPDLQAELDATNRQVEILSDALAESRREVDALVALARADEREACAKVCDDIDVEYEGEDVLATWCSRAIRARGETK
jgi:hypothetical protein